SATARMRPKCSHLHPSATSTGRSWRGIHTSKPRSSTPRATSWPRPSTTCSRAARPPRSRRARADAQRRRAPRSCSRLAPRAGGLVLDLSRLDGVLELDEESLAVTVEPGVYGHHLEAWLRERGYTLGHFPQSIELSTVGGWLACRSAGQYSTRYGRIEDIVLGFDVALANG